MVHHVVGEGYWKAPGSEEGLVDMVQGLEKEREGGVHVLMVSGMERGDMSVSWSW